MTYKFIRKKIFFFQAELFLFFSNIVQNYNLEPEIEGEIPSENYSPGFTILPKPFKVKLLKRG